MMRTNVEVLYGQGLLRRYDLDSARADGLIDSLLVINIHEVVVDDCHNDDSDGRSDLGDLLEGELGLVDGQDVIELARIHVQQVLDDPDKWSSDEVNVGIVGRKRRQQ